MAKEKIKRDKIKRIKRMLDDSCINRYAGIVVDTYTTSVPLLDSLKNVIPHYASTNRENITAKDLLLYIQKLENELKVEREPPKPI